MSKNTTKSDCYFMRAQFETLDRRRLLTAAAEDVVNLDWQGQHVEAVRNEWIVNLQRPTPSINVDGDISLNDVFTFADQPTDKTRPALSALAALGIKFERYLGVENTFLVETPNTVSGESITKALMKVPGFVSIEPNEIAHVTSTTPSDPDFTAQYGLNNTGQVYAYNGSTPISGTADADIDAPEAWDLTTGSASTVVAVLDTGINYNHQDLVSNRWQNAREIPGDGIDNDGNGFNDDVYGRDFVNTDSTPLDDNGHGTFVAGVIAADSNSVGSVGVSWNSKVMAVKVFDSAGSGTSANIVSGVNYVTGLRNKGVNIRVINGSFGLGSSSSSLQSAIQTAGDAGILFVTAAGNNGLNNGSRTTGWNNDTSGQAIYPSSYTNANIISVAATDDDDALATFSNYGSTSVDLGAPGDTIYSTKYNTTSSYGFDSGTSFSSPMVAGVAALAFSMRPDLTVDQVKTAIVNQGTAKSSLSGKTVSGRRLDAFNTVNYINSTYAGYNKTYIGDDGGSPVGDDIRLDVSGSNTLIKRYQSGGYQTVATVANSGSKRIGIFTLGGDDSIVVGTGVLNRLYINSGSGDDTIQGSAGNDTIRGDLGADAIYGNGGDDSIEGGDGNDSVSGGDGNDTIKGQAGVDSLRGGVGDDLFDSDDGIADQVLNGDGGTDTLYADQADVNAGVISQMESVNV